MACAVIADHIYAIPVCAEKNIAVFSSGYRQSLGVDNTVLFAIASRYPVSLNYADTTGEGNQYGSVLPFTDRADTVAEKAVVRTEGEYFSVVITYKAV